MKAKLIVGGGRGTIYYKKPIYLKQLQQWVKKPYYYDLPPINVNIMHQI
jgi:hypothetical protein